jgi:hypothetical protein
MESQKLGRPVFREKLYIEIRIAGQRDIQAARPATHADKQRFPRHLEAFEKRVEPPTEGMPLIEWPKITRTLAEELAFLNVKTVEQLASMKDANLQQIMGGYGFRDQAVKWLATNSAETVDREKEEMRETIALMQEQIEALLAKGKGEPTIAAAPKVIDTTKTTGVNESTPVMSSALDNPIEGAAIPVPAAPAGIPAKTKRKSRRQTT